MSPRLSRRLRAAIVAVMLSGNLVLPTIGALAQLGDAPLRFTVIVPPATFCDPLPPGASGEFMLAFLYWENDGDLPFLIDSFDVFTCQLLQEPGGRSRLIELAAPTIDEKDDVWVHVMLFDAHDVPGNIDELDGLEPFETTTFFGLLNYDLLAQLEPFGSGTGLVPVVTGAFVTDNPKIKIEPRADGDADGDTFSTNNRYESFHDCDDSDISISPFARERLDDLQGARDNNCDGIIGADYQRLQLSTAGNLVLPAQGVPATWKLHRRFRARDEDVVTLLRGTNGLMHLSHIDFNGSNVAEALTGKDVDAVIAIDRETGVPGFKGGARLSPGDLILSFRTSVSTSAFGASGAGLPGPVKPTDLVLFRSESRTFEFFFDGSDVGLGNNTSEDIDAADLVLGGGSSSLKAASLLLSTTGGVNATSGGSTFTANDEDVFVFRPTSFGGATSGSFQLFVDGRPGGWKKDVDALSYLEYGDDLGPIARAGDLLVSTTLGYSTGGTSVEKQDLAIWRPTGGTGVSFRGVLPGEDAGLESSGENVDGVDLDRFAALYGRVCSDPIIDDKFTCSSPLAGIMALSADGDEILAQGSEMDPVVGNAQTIAARSRWLEQLPVGPDGAWGWDRLPPGAWDVSLQWLDPGGSRCIDLPASTFPIDLDANDRTIVNLPLVPQAAHIAGLVFNDLNSNGSYDPGEEGPGDVRLNLYLDDGDATFDPGVDRLIRESAFAAPDGRFSLSLLLVPCTASYWLEQETGGQLLQDNPLRVDIVDFLSVEGLLIGFYK